MTGDRLLERTNVEDVKALIATVRKTTAGLVSKGVVESPRVDVRVLSDDDEGFFQWLAVNYYMGNLTKHSKLAPFFALLETCALPDTRRLLTGEMKDCTEASQHIADAQASTSLPSLQHPGLQKLSKTHKSQLEPA
ncbi:hypothetical protein TcWFU_008301 [Taenia crassiceps]|uniref:Uncharacterized protein n=1 Tax=Taenia crassiceps TaxID=6207 RepID=A0ABR4Q2U8_9CEST